MSRRLALALVGVMLAVVIGQEVHLAGYQVPPVTDIRLHDSRLVAFVDDIRQHNPATVDSLVLNIRRLVDASTQGQDIPLEEAVVAKKLLARLTGVADEKR